MAARIYSKIKKYLLLPAVAVLLIIPVLILARGIYNYLGDPLAEMAKPAQVLKVLSDSTYRADLIKFARVYQDYQMESETTGLVKFSVSFPDSGPYQALPVVIVMGGLEIGRESFSFIENPGYNIIVVYQYPYSPVYWYEGSAFTEIPAIRHAVLKIPAQVLEITGWLKTQSWCDSSRVTVSGYSFGALFMPALYRLAREHDVTINSGVIAYGGVDIYQMLRQNLKKMPEPVKTIFAWLAASEINAVDGLHHAPLLKNRFLLINGRFDDQIPPNSWQRLHQLIPGHQQKIILDEGHMHPKKEYLTKMLVQMSQEWLVQNSVIN